MKTNSILKKLFSKKEKPSSTSTFIAPNPEVAKKKGKGRAFINQRKTKLGRIRQEIPMGKDMFGNIHYKIICHSY
jgi:hypothetical protein